MTKTNGHHRLLTQKENKIAICEWIKNISVTIYIIYQNNIRHVIYDKKLFWDSHAEKSIVETKNVQKLLKLSFFFKHNGNLKVFFTNFRLLLSLCFLLSKSMKWCTLDSCNMGEYLHTGVLHLTRTPASYLYQLFFFYEIKMVNGIHSK